MNDGLPTTVIVEAWVYDLQVAWRLAKGERLGELRAKRAKGFDPRGVHTYSETWGRIFALEDLLPWLQECREQTGPTPLDPVSMRSMAGRVAEQEFAGELAEHGDQVWAK